MQKTRKSISKRFKVSGSGKVIRRSPGRRHFMRRKSAKQKRRMAKDQSVSPGISANIRRAIPAAF